MTAPDQREHAEEQERPADPHHMAPLAGRLLEIPAAVVLVLMVGHVVANALLRWATGQSLPETLEITTYWYLPAIVLVGFVAAARRGEHVAASLLYDRMTTATRRIVDVATDLLVAVVCGAFAWYGAQEAWHNMEIGLTAGASVVVIWPVTFLVPLCFGLMTVFSLTTLIRRLRAGGRANAEDE
ncbi:TRAP transporter small permease [Pseudonocardia nematodicida]|uniref:TRAP transporter small permease n=1 Tax=Pseudonocardia nematodicida TaxID=1206997 RepID=A0ABV1K6N7_9PSEU